MKSKKWLISLGLAVVLVVSFALPACETTPTEYWHTPIADGDQKISFDISTIGASYGDVGLMIVEDLKDFGLDVEHKVLDSGTFLDYLYLPNDGGMEAYVYAEDPSPDPWGDWIWGMLADPENYGYLWNPAWYVNPYFDELHIQNYVAPNLSAKQAIVFEMQEILDEDLPLHYLIRDEFIGVHRTDDWGGWYNEMGGYVSWINEWSILDATPLGAETQLQVGILALMPNMDMNQAVHFYTNVGCLYLMLVYENLVYYPKLTETDAYTFVPKLATAYSVDYEPDGMGGSGENQVWTIDLREGVKWNDYATSGKNWTATDMIYTMKYIQDHWRDNKPMNWTAIEANNWTIEPEHVLVTEINDYQVEWRYVEGKHQNEGFFPSIYLWDAFVPEHVFNADGAPEDPMSWSGNYVATGPYKFKEFVEDSHLLLERNPDYWGSPPGPDEVLFKLYGTAGALFMGLEGGDIDVTDQNAPFAKIEAYNASADLEIGVVKDLSIFYLGFNLHPTAGYEPLGDKVLRQAIAYAIDEQDIVDLAKGGYAEVAYSWVYNESPNFNPDLNMYDFDPTAAANLLTAAGYTKHA